jgi:predicted dehydrogenase
MHTHLASATTAVRRNSPRVSRRSFLAQAATLGSLMIVPRHVLGGPGQVAPSGKITLAGIGMGSQGTQNLAAFLPFQELQVVAVCDVNREGGGYLSWYWGEGKERRTAGFEPARRRVEEHYGAQERSGQYRGCRTYQDYRQLLAKEDVDAVMIATPDHAHAVITMAALKKGKHVYCEKPLTYSVAEARQVVEAARQAGVATQMGNMGQAGEAARNVCEIIWDGAIGPVHEVQVWSPARFWKWSLFEERPRETPPVPEGLDWDLWLGPAPARPYHPEYHPWTWRNWWDFGTGLLGDLGCHKLSTVFKALKLGHPTTVEACSTKVNPETYPLGVIARFEFPARGDMPPVLLTWYDGGLKPPRPAELEPDDPMQDIIYIGEKGKLMGERLIPESRMESYRRPAKTLPRSPGHYHEFVAACRGGPRAGSDFVQHAGLLSEVCLLGNVALRAQKKIVWDGARGRITNDQKANALLARDYRPGWSL